MTFPPDDQGERPGGPWSQPPQYPPSRRRANHPHHSDQPSYDEPGYPPSGRSGYNEPGYNEPGYNEPGYNEPGYDEHGYDNPGYDERGYAGPGYNEPGHPPPRQPGYPQDEYPQAEYPQEEYRQEEYPQGEYRQEEYPYTGKPDYHDPLMPSGTSTAPQDTRRRRPGSGGNTPAFTGLVLGILGLLASLLAPILAIGFGVAGLRRSRRPGRRAGAMAITGIMLGVMWIVLTAVFAVLILRNEGYGSIAALPAGSCFNNAQPGHVAVRVHYLSSCSQPHNGEVVGTFALPGTAWPGQQAVSREAATGCAQLLTSVLGQQSLSSGVRGMNYSPDQQAWSTGTRAVSCVLLDPNAEHTGSMLAGG